jgi:hypothetical protein
VDYLNNKEKWQNQEMIKEGDKIKKEYLNDKVLENLLFMESG